MTRAAEARLMEKVRRGEIVTPLDHIATIDTMAELSAFTDALKTNGRMTHEIRIAAMRRQQQISADLGAASRP